MCDEAWEPLADIIGRLVDGLTAETGRQPVRDIASAKPLHSSSCRFSLAAEENGVADALKSGGFAGSLEHDAGLAVAPGGWVSAAIGEWGKSRRIRAAESFGETDRLAAGGGAASLPSCERQPASTRPKRQGEKLRIRTLA